MNNDRVLIGAEVPEEVLKVFDLSCDSGASKLEIIFEAGKPTRYQATLIDSPSIMGNITIGMFNEFADAIKNTVIKI